VRELVQIQALPCSCKGNSRPLPGAGIFGHLHRRWDHVSTLLGAHVRGALRELAGSRGGHSHPCMNSVHRACFVEGVQEDRFHVSF
jgi:hypothetical protein